jgi:hypothetical protein
MGGCTECKSKSGCDDRKGGMFAAVDQALERLYPTRCWSERDEVAAFRAGISREQGERLAVALSLRLKVLALFRPGGDEECCDFIYLLCVGRPPSIIEIREGTAGPDDVIVHDGLDGAGGAEPEQAPDQDDLAGGVEELYLRVALSGIVRFAGVQQVAMRMVRRADQLVITESPRTGVFDPILLRRFQALVAVLVEHDIQHIDFGEILEPPAGYHPGDYAERYTGEPKVANYLFYPQPCSAVTTTIIEARAAAGSPATSAWPAAPA